MRINNNVMALNTHRQYSINNSNTAKSVEKLSSGHRINQAADDAAGLAISEKMRAQIRGLNMASKNSEDAISLVQTAEGALTETTAILQRMRELSVQSSSDTNENTVDRVALDAEYQQMLSEIDNIAGQTQFNGMTLLNGTISSPATAAATGLAAGITVSADSTVSTGTISIANVSDWDAGTGVSGTGGLNYALVGFGIALASVAAGSIGAGSMYNGGYHLKASGPDMSNMTFDLVSFGGVTVASTGSISISAGNTAELDFGNYGTLDVTIGNSATRDSLVAGFTGTGTTQFFEYGIFGGVDGVASATIGGQSVSQGDASVTLAQGVTLDISGLDAADWASQNALNTALFGSTTGSASVAVTASEQGKTIQTGANEGDTLSITIDDMTTVGLGVNGTNILTHNSASLSITSTNNAIKAVSAQRAKLGAFQNRLEHKINNLDASSENLQTAESRIRDVDMAQEMTTFTANNILVQAATSMLAQANQAPQGVLKLLG